MGAGSSQIVYTYNDDRQPTRIARPDGRNVDFGYDSAGRLETLAIERGTFNYGYDPATGALITITAPDDGSLFYAYDGFLRTQTTWSGAVTGSISRTYDNNFRVTDLSINGGNTISFQYDDDNLLTQAGDLVVSHDAQNGLLLGSTLSNVSDTWNHNVFAETTAYSAAYNTTALYHVTYTRDKLGRITETSETIGGVTTVFSYAYDLAGRLTEVRQNGSLSASYTYDSNSNRLSYTGPGGPVNGTYDDQDRLQQYGSTSYSYTNNGELLTKTVGSQVTSYQYDELGNLTAVTLPDTTQIEYIIDGQNRRIGKRVNGTLQQGFLYQDGLNPVAELDGVNNIVSQFIYASRPNIPDTMIRGGITYRFISDHLGSPRLIVDIATGAIAQRMDYDEFGNVIEDTNPGFQPFGFAGGLYDSDTGLVRFGARDYDPEIGRWTTKDPIRFDGEDPNLYAYVGNDPVNNADPSGLYNCKIPFCNGKIEKALRQEAEKNGVDLSKKGSKAIREEMTEQEFKKLRDEKTNDEEKLEILKEIAERIQDDPNVDEKIKEELERIRQQLEENGTCDI